jgi:hypothetical protein
VRAPGQAVVLTAVTGGMAIAGGEALRQGWLAGLGLGVAAGAIAAFAMARALAAAAAHGLRGSSWGLSFAPRAALVAAALGFGRDLGLGPAGLVAVAGGYFLGEVPLWLIHWRRVTAPLDSDAPRLKE